MMRMSIKNDLLPPPVNGSGGAGGGGGGAGGEKEWELRPSGLLVQKRTDSEQDRALPPMIRVRVKYGSVYHEIRISSQATFGELKKILSGPTGLHHQDQKLSYKDKERDSKAFLDTVGIKDKSKLMLQEDPISKEKRYIEMKKSVKMEKAAKSVSEISLNVDRLAGQVSALESIISKGGKVEEKMFANLIELLMNNFIKLEAITVDGDVKLQRKMQVKRVQKYVETLDMLKIKNLTPTKKSNGVVSSLVKRDINGSVSSPVQAQQARHSFEPSPMDSPRQEKQTLRHSASGSAFLITTKWETFDSMPAPVSGPPPTSKTGTSTIHSAQPSFTWDLL